MFGMKSKKPVLLKEKGDIKMSDLSAEQKDYYKQEAEDHADFLCEKVFKPAFIMAFIHGVKHGREDEKILLKGNMDDN